MSTAQGYQAVENDEETGAANRTSTDDDAGRRTSQASSAVSMEESEEEDSDLDIPVYSSDEEEGEDGEKKKKEKKKGTALGEWKANLRKSTQDVFPENELQRVKWGWVAAQFVLNGAAFGLFLGFVFVARIGAMFSLFAYLSTLIMGTVVGEVLYQRRPQEGAGILVLLVGATTGGCVAMGPFDFFQQLAHASALLMFGVVSALWVAGARKDIGGALHRTALWRALTSKRYTLIREETEFAALMKSLTHRRLPKPSRGAALMNRCFAKLGWSTSTISVEMVRIEENSCDVPDVSLSVADEDIEPYQYVLTGLLLKDENGVSTELTVADFERVLAKRKNISDKMLDSWINPAKRPGGQAATTDTAAAGAAVTDTAPAADTVKNQPPEVKVRDWMHKVKLAPNGQCVVIAQLSRASYLDGVSSHWAPKVAWCVVWCCLLALPTAHIFMQIDLARRQICDVGGEHALNPVGPQHLHERLFCDSSATDSSVASCLHACASYLNFTAVVHDTFHLSFLELLLVVVMLPTFVFTYVVRNARSQHNQEEFLYFCRMQEAKNAVHEVLRHKVTLENIFKIDFLKRRLQHSFKAWRGADDNLKACGPITDAEFELTKVRSANDCLKEVMGPVASITSAISAERSPDLPFGIGFTRDKNDETGEEEDDEDMKGYVVNGWEMLKLHNNIGGKSDRNYKVLFDLKMHTEDSWKLFKKWIEQNYKEQLEYITTQQDIDAQDSGEKCHLVENVRIHDILLPRGFSFTHLYVQSMPEDGKPFQIDLRGYKKGAQGFWDACNSCVASIKSAVVDNEEYDPEEDEDTSLLDFRLDKSPLVARFALSEQYFENMPMEEITRLCPNIEVGLAKPRPSFTEFVDGLLQPTVFMLPSGDEEEELPNILLYTGISIFMGDENPFRAVVASVRRLMEAVSVYLQCAGLALLIPILRFTSGGEFFPQPFAIWTFLNTLSIWWLLVSFFADFHIARTRLSLIGECLGILYKNTLAPPSATSGEDAKDGDSEEKKKKEAAEDTQPFELVLGEMKQSYEPGSDFWKQAWRRKYDNVRNWHATVRYLRIFVSTSRLTAQTMLAAAVVVVGALLVMSLAQAVAGPSSDSALSAAIHDRTQKMLASAADGGQTAARRLHEEIAGAISALSAERAAALAGTLAAATWEHGGAAEEASQGLRAALAPTRAAVHGVLVEQHEALARGHKELREKTMVPPELRAVLSTDEPGRRLGEAEDEVAASQAGHLVKAMKVTKATKTQIFTIAMVLFVLLYSVPLMWNVIVVNGHYDYHHDLLLKQMEEHRVYQSRREWRRRHGGAEPPKEGEDSMPQASDSGDATAQPEASKEEGAEGAEGGKTGEEAPIKDIECRRYEKILGMAIEAAAKNRERFPLKLFGFVITTQLLATWVGLAAAPIMTSAKTVAPPMISVGCRLFAQSRLVHSLQHQVTESNPELHMNVSLLIHDNLCAPLDSMIASHMAAAGAATVDACGMGAGPLPLHADSRRLSLSVDADAPRRLLAVVGGQTGVREVYAQDLTATARRWWHATHDVHPQDRYAVGRRVLMELGREGSRALVSEPRAVLRAFSERAPAPGAIEVGDAAFWDASLETRPSIKRALADLDRDESAELGDEL